jgi:hypothetical protein
MFKERGGEVRDAQRERSDQKRKKKDMSPKTVKEAQKRHKSSGNARATLCGDSSSCFPVQPRIPSKSAMHIVKLAAPDKVVLPGEDGPRGGVILVDDVAVVTVS